MPPAGDRRNPGDAHDQAAARTRRQGSGLRGRGRRSERPRPSGWPTARCTTPARAAARSSGSTCTKRSTTPSSMPSSRSEGLQLGRPDGRGHLHRRAHARAAARRARGAGRRRHSKGATVLTGGERASSARATGSSRPCSLTSTTRWRDARGELRSGHRHPEVSGDEEAVELMNDTRYGLTAGVYTRDEARAADCSRESSGQRVLELLRPREPAPALDGRRRFGHRPHAVDLRNPDVHAAEGLAPAQGVSPARAGPWPAAQLTVTSPIGIRFIRPEGTVTGCVSSASATGSRGIGIVSSRASLVAHRHQRGLGAAQRVGDGLVGMHLDRCRR